MAHRQSSISLIYTFVVFSLLLYAKQSFAIEVRQLRSVESKKTHRVSNKESNPFIQSDSCNTSPTLGTSSANKTTLTLVHAHGPCSSFNKHVKSPLELLAQDQTRLKMINTKLGVEEDATTVNAYDGSKIGSGGYIVQVGLGTPSNQLYLSMDTGSDLTWTQCLPCIRCYPQNDPVFDPSKSSTYSSIPCGSSACQSAQGTNTGCSGTTCAYKVQYGSATATSTTSGVLSQDVLTVNDPIGSVVFGCGNNNYGTMSGEAGFLGLGRGSFSIITQKGSTLNNQFSYCLPSTISGTGYLALGSGGNTAKYYVPFSPSIPSPFYGMELSSFQLGGTTASISPPLPMIIDTGTTVSRLPPKIYAALRDLFKASMSAYPAAPAASILDTCYDLSGSNGNVNLPAIDFTFGETITLTLTTNNIYAISLKQVCLAYAPTTGRPVLGNTQQKSFEFTLDIGGSRVGLSSGCD